ncbi:MAG: aldose 1-epimerase [Planctomycetota bacterium]
MATAPNTVTITDAQTGSTAQVLVSLGFNCFSWRPALGDGQREMLWAPDSFAGGEDRPSSAGTPLLFPFPGRIGGAKLSFGGAEYALPARDSFGNALHGFAFDHAWRIVDQQPNAVRAEFQLSVDAPECAGMWPSDHRLACQYRVAGRKLELHVEYENVGDEPMPCGFGTHAYFRLPLAEGSDVEQTVITAPVDAEWRMESMLPVGDPAPLPSDTPLAEGVSLTGRSFDTPYRSTAPADAVVTEVRDPATGRVLRQTAEGGFASVVIYTPGHREAVCLEPYTCVPDPLRLEAEGHTTGLEVLAPGESSRRTVVLEVLDSTVA